MDYRAFITAVKAQDSRNAFDPGRSDEDVTQLPSGLRTFYAQCDPVDVEIVLSDLTSIKLTPLADLPVLQREYSPTEEIFVFATREGDPIACRDGAIVTWAHGSQYREAEKLGDNFDSWLERVVSEMRD